MSLIFWHSDNILLTLNPLDNQRILINFQKFLENIKSSMQFCLIKVYYTYLPLKCLINIYIIYIYLHKCITYITYTYDILCM